MSSKRILFYLFIIKTSKTFKSWQSKPNIENHLSYLRKNRLIFCKNFNFIFFLAEDLPNQIIIGENIHKELSEVEEKETMKKRESTQVVDSDELKDEPKYDELGWRYWTHFDL